MELISDAPSLVRLIDENDNVVMLAFLAPDGIHQGFSVEETALAPLCFAVGGWTVPPSLLPEVLTVIWQSQARENLAAVIEAAIVANSTALKDGDEDITNGVQAAVQQLIEAAQQHQLMLVSSLGGAHRQASNAAEGGPNGALHRSE